LGAATASGFNEVGCFDYLQITSSGQARTRYQSNLN
jgi:hypothetical protein